MAEHPTAPSTGGPDESGSAAGGPGRRRPFWTLLVAALVGAGVWLLIAHAASFSQVLDALRRAQPAWLGLAVAAVAGGYLGYALLFQALAAVERGPRPGLPLTLRVAVAVFGASIVATAAGRLGAEYLAFRRMGQAPPRAWDRVLAINTAAWAVLAALAWSGSLLLVVGVGPRVPLELELAWLLVPPLCVPPAVYLSSPGRRRLTHDVGGRVRRTFASVMRSLVLLRRSVAQRRTLARGVTGSLIYWAAELLTLWAALRSMGVELGYAPLVVGYATGYAVTMLPLPAGGAGGVEAAGTLALTLVGVPLAPALLAVVVQRLCTYWLPLAVAILGAGSIRRLAVDLAAMPAPGCAGKDTRP